MPAGFQTTDSEGVPYREYLPAAEKGYPGIGRTAEGGPDFAGSDYLYPANKGQSSIVKIKLTGSRSGGFDLANAKGGFAKQPSGYSWQHLDDYDPVTGEATLQLVGRAAHEATYPHSGGVAQYEHYNNVEYGR